MKSTQAEAISLLFRPQHFNTKLNDHGQIVLENARSRQVEFKHSSAISLMGFLWMNAKKRNIVITETKDCKVVITPFCDDGFAKFTMELHVRSNPDFTSVENILPMNIGKVTKTRFSKMPRSVERMINEKWFNEIKSILNMFNEHSYYANGFK